MRCSLLLEHMGWKLKRNNPVLHQTISLLWRVPYSLVFVNIVMVVMVRSKFGVQLLHKLNKNRRLMYCWQDPYRKIVLEKKYKGKFSCFTFERKSASPCWVSDGEVDEDDPVLEEAVLTYARENLAMIKVFMSILSLWFFFFISRFSYEIHSTLRLPEMWKQQDYSS